MKRVLTLLLTVSLLFGLTACGGSSVTDDTTTPADSETTPAPEDTTVAPEDTTAAPEPLPTSDISVCGNDLAQYRAVAYVPYRDDAAAEVFDASFDAICEASLGFVIPHETVRSTTAVSKAVEEANGKVLIFTTYATSLPGFPRLDGAIPNYGVTEEGGIYVNTSEALLYTYLWRAFLQETLGTGWNPAAPASSGSLTAFQNTPDLFSEESLAAMGYASVFEDNFDGDTLSDAWETRGSGARGGGYISASQAEVSDGILTLTGEYLTDGEFGEGFYSSFIHLKQWYRRGYFESSIMSNEYSGYDFWSAFWIQGPSPYDPAKSQGGAGEGGAELDILEYFGDEAIQCNIYCAGGKNPASTELDADHMVYPYDNSEAPFYQGYHTFGLLWDENGYIFQLDGIPYFCRSFYNGTSNVPEEVILSVCIPDTIKPTRKTVPAEMKVDYLKIWQIPEAN